MPTSFMNLDPNDIIDEFSTTKGWVNLKESEQTKLVEAITDLIVDYSIKVERLHSYWWLGSNFFIHFCGQVGK